MKKLLAAVAAVVAVAGMCAFGACGEFGSGGADDVAGKKYKVTDCTVDFSDGFPEELIGTLDVDALLDIEIRQGVRYAFGEDGCLYDITAGPGSRLPCRPSRRASGERQNANMTARSILPATR